MIEFIRFDNSSSSHLVSSKEFLSDKELFERVRPLISNVLSGEEDAFLIKINEEIVGAIDFNIYNKSCYVSYCILKNKRGNKLSPFVLNYVKSYVYNHYPEAIDISLRIEPNNEKSSRAALSAGYSLMESDNKTYLNYVFDLKKIINVEDKRKN